jgi:hypothetical protein
MLPYGIILLLNAPIAQLDRASDYESVGRGFESSWARHFLASFRFPAESTRLQGLSLTAVVLNW